MSSPLRIGYDPTHYPVEDDVGESLLQRNLTEELRASIIGLAAERGQVMLVGANQFVYYRQFHPTDSVAPDVYVIPGVPPDTPVTAWKTWERAGVVPSFALEVVSTDAKKDYERAPRRYAELGVAELVVFDPDGAVLPDRVRWQIYRRQAGEFVLEAATKNDRIRSEVLACWLRAVGAGPLCRVRLARDPAGEVLVPTAIEAERSRREAAEAELVALRAEVERLRRGQ